MRVQGRKQTKAEQSEGEREMDSNGLRCLLVEPDWPLSGYRYDQRLVDELLSLAEGTSLRLTHCRDVSLAARRFAKGGVDGAFLGPLAWRLAGLDLLQRLHWDVPDLPVVVLSETDDPGDRSSAQKQGARAFLHRSEWNGPALEASLRDAVAGVRAGAAANGRPSSAEQPPPAEYLHSLGQVFRKAVANNQAAPGMLLRRRDDEHWTIEYVSDGCLQLTGYPRGDLIGNRKRSFSQIVHPDDRQRQWRVRRASLTASGVTNATYRIVSAKGEEIWVRETGCWAYLPKEDRFVHEAFVENIQGQRIAQLRLWRLEGQYGAIADARGECICRFEPDWRLSFANPAFAHLLERSIKNMVGQELLSLLPPESGKVFLRHRLLLGPGNPRVTFRCPFVSPQGQERNMEWQLQRIQDKELFTTEYQAIGRDITHVKRFESPLGRDRDELERQVQRRTDELARANVQLQQSEDTSRMLLNASLDVALMLDTAGKILALNSAGALVLGCSQTEAIGRSVWSFFTEEVAARRKAKVAEVVRTGEPVRFEDADRGRHFDSTIQPGFNAQMDVDRVAVFARDITEFRQLQTKILEIGSEEQHRLGADLHDGLCQQLAGITMMIDVAAKGAAQGLPIDPSEMESISSLLNQALSETRRLSLGLQPVGSEPQSLWHVLRTLAKSADQASGPVVRFAGRRPVEVHDEEVASHLFRIAQEALNNAVQHSACRRIDIRLGEQDGTLVMRVTDDGVGITNTDKGDPGMGLNIMRFRARTIGAALTIGPGRNGGTAVTCVMSAPVS